MNGTLALHLSIGATVLTASMALPRAGSAVLLLPIQSHATMADAGFLSRHQLTLLGRGAIAGSMLVRSSGPVPTLALIEHGFLPVSAPMRSCSPRAAAQNTI